MGLGIAMVFGLWASTMVLANPFLSNAPRALTTLAASASSSASVPSEPLTHIADLRVKQQKAEKLQAEKQLAEDDTATFPEDEEENNEAAPSLFQKKVNKILTKLRIISSLSNNAASARLVEKTGQGEELEDLNNEIVNNTTDSIEEISTEDVPTFQKVIYPHSRNGVPLRLRFNLNEKLVEGEEKVGVEDEKMTGRLEQIGVFFAELLGSLFGLVYGAAAQINNTIQGTTAANLD